MFIFHMFVSFGFEFRNFFNSRHHPKIGGNSDFQQRVAIRRSLGQNVNSCEKQQNYYVTSNTFAKKNSGFYEGNQILVNNTAKLSRPNGISELVMMLLCLVYSQTCVATRSNCYVSLLEICVTFSILQTPMRARKE